jgi:hypothetical protein
VGGDDVSLGNFYVFNRNASTFAFVGTTRSHLDQAIASAAAPGSVMQLYRAAVHAPYTLPLPTEAQQITNSDSPFKSELAISDSGMSVAYVASESSSASASSSIHVVMGNSEMPVVAGTQPQWYSDAAFYYVGADGVRLHDGALRRSTLVLPIETQGNYKIAVSPNRSLLAFSVPDSSSVFFYRISDNGLLLSLASTVMKRGYWIVFSPDSKYVAIQTATDANAGGRSQPSLSIVDTSTFKDIGTIPLTPLLNDHLFVTDWVN